ncbi:MAG: hypothetical protein E7598_01190 [Ruminococcaceae bacterium]|nr:hypothetical protein [Oscillospiraceae bacterium]
MKSFFKKYFGVILSSLFATYAVYEKFMLPELQIPMIASIIFVVIFAIFYKTDAVITKVPFYAKLSYSLFAFFFVVGDSFKYYGSFFGIFGNPFRNTTLAVDLFEDFASLFGFLNGTAGNLLMILSAVCKTVGYYFIIRYTFELIKHYGTKALEKGANGALPTRIFSKNKIFKAFLFLVICWLPYFIIKMPVVISNDGMTQINQFLKNEITTHHPYFVTLIYGSFAKLGVLCGNMYIGLTVYIILQYAFMAGSFAYCISKADDMHNNHLFSFIVLLLFAFSPAVASYSTTIVKDALYSTLVVLYIFQIITVLYNTKNNLKINKNIVALSILAIFVILTRNNGIYVVGASLAFLLVWLLFRKGETFKSKTAFAALLVLPIAVYMGFNFLQYDVIGLTKGSVAEVLSIPFQQTARYVKEHPEDVTEEEAEIINKVLDYERLAELYNPIVSDPVKATYKKDESALGDYFKVWFEQLKKHPQTYFEATIHSNYFAFYPDEPNIRAYAILGENSGIAILDLLKYALLVFSMAISLIPIVTCVINPVFYVWIFIYLLFRSFAKKDWTSLAIMLALTVQLLTVIAGPGVFNHPRYLYPISWSIPFVVGYFALPQKRT